MKTKKTEQKLTVRFPVGLLDKLRSQANKENRSLNGQIIWILNHAVAQEEEKK